MFSWSFWADALDRAIKTAAQVALLVILGPNVADAASGTFNAFSIDWGPVAGYALGGFILSVLFSVLSSNLGKVKGSPQVIAPANPSAGK